MTSFTELAGSDYFRLIVIPCSAATTGVFIRWVMVVVKRSEGAAAVWSVWADLEIIAIFNLLSAAAEAAARARGMPSLTAKERSVFDDYLLQAAFGSLFLGLALTWSAVSSARTHKRWNTLHSQVVPHAVAVVMLAATLLFAMKRLP
jgi:hypothetical protein